MDNDQTFLELLIYEKKINNLHFYLITDELFIFGENRLKLKRLNFSGE
jgi:hypothetical protein